MTSPDLDAGTSTLGAPTQFYEASQRNIVCGYPKTGRTWLRYMLANALVLQSEIDLDVDFTNVYSVVPNDDVGHIDGQPVFMHSDQIPKIEMTHQLFDSERHTDTNRIFLTRDPRDIMVSHWLHNKNQIKIYSGGIDEFVRDSQQGIDAFLAHLESWAPQLSLSEVMPYEVMRVNPVSALKRVFASFHVNMPDDIVTQVVEASTIEKMRKKEVEKGIAGHDYDRSNPEALRIRRGKVGGFTDYLTAEDQAFIHQKIEAASRVGQEVIALTGYKPTVS